MTFEKNTKVGNGKQVDTFHIVIPFSELPNQAVEEIQENYIEYPEVRVDIENGQIHIEEEITHSL